MRHTKKAASAPRMGRPKATEAQNKLQQVIEAAREQFVTLGYRAVTMRGVAEKANVSTRTLYNRYEDKLSLFVACVDFGAGEIFPRLQAQSGMDLQNALRHYAADLVRTLSSDSSLRLVMMVFREGGEIPEILRASEANYHHYLIKPLASFFRAVGLDSRDPDNSARLFIAMALSEWQRRATYQHPLPYGIEVDSHAEFAARVFLNGMHVGEAPTNTSSKAPSRKLRKR